MGMRETASGTIPSKANHSLLSASKSKYNVPLLNMPSSLVNWTREWLLRRTHHHDSGLCEQNMGKAHGVSKNRPARLFCDVDEKSKIKLTRRVTQG